MGKTGLFDLERHFAFYGAYHSNPINIAIHTFFVWPIFFTALVILYFVPSPFNLPSIEISLIGNNIVLPLNIGFLVTLIYAVFYVCLDVKAGCLAAFLCFVCWVFSGYLASQLGFSLAWKPATGRERYQYLGTFAEFSVASVFVWFVIGSIHDLGKFNCYNPGLKVVLVAQLVCWTGQFIGHGVFEKRAPALLDNLSQAFLMAPFFVLLEVLQVLFGYEPYPGFHAAVEAKIEAEIREWQEKKKKLIS